MNLTTVLKGQPFHSLEPIPDETITGVSFEADKVEPGFLYVIAKPLANTDIQVHIQKAIQKGAKFILKDRTMTVSSSVTGVTFLNVVNARAARSRIAANLFPGQPDKVVVITGTNGKTSVTHFLRQIWELLGTKCVCMGTTGLYGNVDLKDLDVGNLTSPDALKLHYALSSLKKRGCTHLTLEASSHGLDQRRLDCLDISAAGFTNLSHDHLDYHQNMDAYFESKLRLFKDLLPPGAGAVLNADDFRFVPLLATCRERGHRVVTFGRESRDIQLVNVILDGEGQLLEIKVFGKQYKVHLPLIGVIQSYNVMCALGLAIVSGWDEQEVVKVLPQLKSVPGRFEWVGSLKNGTKVFVDFAHTPAALETLLTSLRPHTKGNINLVFGCGGDRDRLKRPLMGQVASQLADRVYITDDNPRSEDPGAIRAAILKTCPGAVEIGDRSQAIATALAKCGPQDVCVIAGKGHEKGQIIGEEVFPFDDRLVTRQAINQLEGTVL